MIGTLLGCGSKHNSMSVLTSAPSAPRQDVRVKVVDVSNRTQEVFDVDAIGMLWNGLEESLRNKGLLWTKGTSAQVLTLEAEILQYKEGSLAWRTVPFMGNTVLTVKCDVKSEGRVIATAEAKRTMSIGSGGLTLGAYKKIFPEVCKELVDQISKKI
jgi:putative N-acetylmannosamine-6-phosphate epimerase